MISADSDWGATRAGQFRSADPFFALSMPKYAVAFLQLRPVTHPETREIVVTSPANRVVYQRDQNNQASIPMEGSFPQKGGRIEARLTPVDSDEPPGDWTPVAEVTQIGKFSGELHAKAGWYELEVRAGKIVKKIPRVGVGEVFLIAGHSVAQGGSINLPGSNDDRVNTVALNDPDQERKYDQTGDPAFLPFLQGTVFADGIKPAPFGHGTYFWARWGERIARRENVPVLILNAGFGGTSLEHWAKSARGENFEHSFVRSSLRMPYANVRNAVIKYARRTGLRAILADQGQNDADETDAKTVFHNYAEWVSRARQDLGWTNLAVVVNRQTPYLKKTAIRIAQEMMIQEIPYCFPGPDYDQLSASDRPDGIHFGPAGAEKAARLWEAALGSDFWKKSLPCPPSTP